MQRRRRIRRRPRPLTPPSFDGVAANQPLTPRQMARWLQVSPATLRRLIKRDRIPCVKTGGQLRFVAGDVWRYLAERGGKPS